MVKEPVARRIPLEPGADRARDLAVAQLLSVPVARIEEVELVSAGHVVVEGYRLAVGGDTRGLAIVGREASSRSTSASSVSDIRSQTASVSPLRFPGRANVFTVMCCIVVCVQNVGATDKRVRTALGAVFGIASIGTLSGAVSLPPIAAPVLGVASLLMLGTAATGVCGLYALLGVDTCPVSAVDSR